HVGGRGQARRDGAGLGIAHLIGLDADRVFADRGHLGGRARHDFLDRGGGRDLVGTLHVVDGELRAARELDRELDRPEQGHQRRSDHEDRGDEEPQLAAADEREGRLAGVEVVAELTHGGHQSSPSVVERLSAEWAASLRSAMVWRRSASARERPARRWAAPLAAAVSTGARNWARPRYTAPRAVGSSPDSGWPPPKKRVRASSCI